jgi:hypothetical protein
MANLYAAYGAAQTVMSVSPASDYITGQITFVNGGFSATCRPPYAERPTARAGHRGAVQ